MPYIIKPFKEGYRVYVHNKPLSKHPLSLEQAEKQRKAVIISELKRGGILPIKLDIVKSHLPNKKYDAVFHNEFFKKVVPFGAIKPNGEPYEDYTMHHDKKRRDLYIKRHQKNEHWDDPYTSGALSLFILWGSSTNINTNIKTFKKLFNFV